MAEASDNEFEGAVQNNSNTGSGAMNNHLHNNKLYDNEIMLQNNSTSTQAHTINNAYTDTGKKG